MSGQLITPYETVESVHWENLFLSSTAMSRNYSKKSLENTPLITTR